MADHEALDVLAKGVEAWNTWRNETRDTPVDLSSAALGRANLLGHDLSNIDLGGAFMREAILSGANLTGARLCRANMRGADLTRAILTRADLSDATLIDTIYRSHGKIPEAFLAAASPRTSSRT